MKREGVDVLFVSNAASRSGAPLLLLNLLRWLRERSELSFQVLLVAGGPEEDAYREIAPTIVLRDELSGRNRLTRAMGRMPWVHRWVISQRRRRLRRRIGAMKPRLVYANTAATAEAIESLAPDGSVVLAHVHELNCAIEGVCGRQRFQRLMCRSAHVIAVSQAVAENLTGSFNVQEESMSLVHGYLPIEDRLATRIEADRRAVFEELGLPANALLVGGCGTLGLRKGADVFVQVARQMLDIGGDAPIHFIWIGGETEPRLPRFVKHDIRALGLSDRIHLIGARSNALDYLSAVDIVLLTSREDPYPLVVLEAASLGKPTICFAGAGGAPEFVEEDCGRVVGYLNAATMAREALHLLEDRALRRALGENAAAKVRRRHSIDDAAPMLLEIMEQFLPWGRQIGDRSATAGGVADAIEPR